MGDHAQIYHPAEKSKKPARQAISFKKEKAGVQARQMEKADMRINQLLAEQEEAAFESSNLIEIERELEKIVLEKENLEQEWLQVMLSLDS